MEYLSLNEIRSQAEVCRAHAESLLTTKSLVGKPKSRQWRFFRDAIARLLSESYTSDLDGLPAAQAAQLKFEIEDKLKQFYLRDGNALRFVFVLVHHSDLGMYGIEEDSYPRLCGYCVVVRDLLNEQIGQNATDGRDLPLYLERIVGECVDAEFAAYAALPEIRTDQLKRWFAVNSPAYREVLHILTHHRQRGWVISNALNPSTKRLLTTKVKQIQNGEATVNTMEYWYLKWWDTRKKRYVYPYRETNRQMYILQKTLDGWRVVQNLRPAPRSSVPGRWKTLKEQTKNSSK